MIVNIRGTHGSGKTTLVRKYMDHIGVQEIVGNPKRPDGYILNNGVLVVGSYETVCGGCDTIKTQDAVEQAVRDHAPKGGVLFEGALISTIHGRWANLGLEVGNTRFLVLSTPLEECLRRINKRRKDRNPSATDVDPTNTEAKYRTINRGYDKLLAEGLVAIRANNEEAFDYLLEWLP